MMVEHDHSSLVAAGAADTLVRIIRARRARESLFGPELFADPAWDFLLELSLARLERRTVGTADLIQASNVAESTAFRWIDKLEQDGWIERFEDVQDRGHSLVDLSQKGAEMMQAWIKELLESQPGSGGRVARLLERIDRGRRDS